MLETLAIFGNVQPQLQPQLTQGIDTALWIETDSPLLPQGCMWGSI